VETEVRERGRRARLRSRSHGGSAGRRPLASFARYPRMVSISMKGSTRRERFQEKAQVAPDQSKRRDRARRLPVTMSASVPAKARNYHSYREIEFGPDSVRSAPACGARGLYKPGTKGSGHGV